MTDQKRSDLVFVVFLAVLALAVSGMIVAMFKDTCIQLINAPDPLTPVRVVSTTANGDAWDCGARGYTVIEVVESGERTTVCNQLGTPGETFNYRLP